MTRNDGALQYALGTRLRLEGRLGKVGGGLLVVGMKIVWHDKEGFFAVCVHTCVTGSVNERTLNGSVYFS